MPQTDVIIDPAALIVQAAALRRAHELLACARGARVHAIVARDSVPAGGDQQWLGPASDAFRARGAALVAAVGVVVDDIEAGLALIASEVG